MELLEKEGSGIIVYLRSHEGRGIGLLNKIEAYRLQDTGLDTVEANQKLGFSADPRSFLVAAQILKVLGVHRVRLLTNNPRKISDLENSGIQVNERIPLESQISNENRIYLNTKREKLGHLLRH